MNSATERDHYGRRAEHEDGAQRLLGRLREAGAGGVTTAELIRERHYGLRPPNRILDLRRAGHSIETRREPHGVFRFILIREAENPIEPGPAKKKVTQDKFSDSADWYERATGKPRQRVSTDSRERPLDTSDLPLFASPGVR